VEQKQAISLAETETFDSHAATVQFPVFNASTTAMDKVSATHVRSQLECGASYQEILQQLKALYPNITRGLSARSVRRYVEQNGLQKEVEEHINTVVQESVHEVSAH